MKQGDARESSLGDLDPGTVQILLQTSIELGQTTVFQVGDTLLLVLDIATGSEFVGRHCGWIWLKESEKGGRGGILDRLKGAKKLGSPGFSGVRDAEKLGKKGTIKKVGKETDTKE